MVIPICLIRAELQPMVRCFNVAATGQPASCAVLRPWFLPFTTTVNCFLDGMQNQHRVQSCSFQWRLLPTWPAWQAYDIHI